MASFLLDAMKEFDNEYGIVHGIFLMKKMELSYVCMNLFIFSTLVH